MSQDVLVTGRLVGGHPIRRNPVTDNKGNPKLNADGEKMTQVYIGIAVPKTQADWRQEPWGQQIAAVAEAAWPRGEHRAPTFAWKVTDGDSDIPNKNNSVPNQREGYPGHWVLACATNWHVKCYHPNKYDPHQQIQDEKEIKTGDYCRVVVSVKGNDSTDSPGVYLNPSLFELSRAGKEIILDNGPSAAEMFGGSSAQLPSNGQFDDSVKAPQQEQQQTASTTPPPPPPANDLVTPPPPPPSEEEKYEYGGQVKTKSEWLAIPGYTEAHLKAMTKV